MHLWKECTVIRINTLNVSMQENQTSYHILNVKKARFSQFFINCSEKNTLSASVTLIKNQTQTTSLIDKNFIEASYFRIYA